MAASDVTTTLASDWHDFQNKVKRGLVLAGATVILGLGQKADHAKALLDALKAKWTQIDRDRRIDEENKREEGKDKERGTGNGGSAGDGGSGGGGSGG